MENEILGLKEKTTKEIEILINAARLRTGQLQQTDPQYQNVIGQIAQKQQMVKDLELLLKNKRKEVTE